MARLITATKGGQNELRKVVRVSHWVNIGYIVCSWVRWCSHRCTRSRSSGSNTYTSSTNSIPYADPASRYAYTNLANRYTYTHPPYCHIYTYANGSNTILGTHSPADFSATVGRTDATTDGRVEE